MPADQAAPSGLAGFDDRIVEYEKIHKIKETSVKMLVDAVSAQPNQRILDGMAGYGSVSRWLLDRCAEYRFVPELYIVEESPIQEERARKNLPEVPADHIRQADIRRTGFNDGFFDAVVIKMGVHELPQGEQPKVFAEAFRVLRPGGRLVVWELALDPENQKVFQDIIREKDRLAGFDAMVMNRYFPRHDELRELFKHAGFTDVGDYHWITYQPSTLARKEELVSKEKKRLLEAKAELSQEDSDRLDRLGEERAAKLAEYVRLRIPQELREKMGYEDPGSDVRFLVQNVIMVGLKPSDTTQVSS